MDLGKKMVKYLLTAARVYIQCSQYLGCITLHFLTDDDEEESSDENETDEEDTDDTIEERKSEDPKEIKLVRACP